jgi:TetR/AcrR family transcriptional regulator, transcriptional repressor of bet genes
VPKVVDHEERREAIAEAVWRVAERDGVEGITLRAVAAEAGWSTGVVAHYFAGKDDLLAFAFELANARGSARAARRARRARDPLAALRAMLEQSLPLDAERRLEARIWFGFLGRAAIVEAMGEVVRRHYEAWVASVADAIRGAQEARLVSRRRDPYAEATALLGLVDGLTVQALAAPERLPARLQRRALADALERLAD